jgi:transcriptional regulator with XRE-family HTH domain
LNLEQIFGKVLKKVRIEKGLSQEKLAEYCMLDRTYISLLERGLRQPTLKTIFSIANALEISPTVLIQEVEKLNENFKD